MSETSESAALAEARALRTEAWTLVRGDVALLRDGLSEKTIAARIKERATDEVVDAIDTARAVAEDNKAVVALTLAALLGWMLRHPIVRLAKTYLPGLFPGS